jgi:hypothetical protein
MFMQGDDLGILSAGGLSLAVFGSLNAIKVSGLQLGTMDQKLCSAGCALNFAFVTLLCNYFAPSQIIVHTWKVFIRSPIGIPID